MSSRISLASMRWSCGTCRSKGPGLAKEVHVSANMEKDQPMLKTMCLHRVLRLDSPELPPVQILYEILCEVNRQTPTGDARRRRRGILGVTLILMDSRDEIRCTVRGEGRAVEYRRHCLRTPFFPFEVLQVGGAISPFSLPSYCACHSLRICEQLIS